MTRRELFRFLVAMRFAACGNHSVFMWMCPRGMKELARSNIERRRHPVLLKPGLLDRMLAESGCFQRLFNAGTKVSGGTYIQSPFTY